MAYHGGGQADEEDSAPNLVTESNGVGDIGGSLGRADGGSLGIAPRPPSDDAQHDLSSALIAWSERGDAPERIVATSLSREDPVESTSSDRLSLSTASRVSRDRINECGQQLPVEITSRPLKQGSDK